MVKQHTKEPGDIFYPDYQRIQKFVVGRAGGVVKGNLYAVERHTGELYAYNDFATEDRLGIGVATTGVGRNGHHVAVPGSIEYRGTNLAVTGVHPVVQAMRTASQGETVSCLMPGSRIGLLFSDVRVVPGDLVAWSTSNYARAMYGFQSFDLVSQIESLVDTEVKTAIKASRLFGTSEDPQLKIEADVAGANGNTISLHFVSSTAVGTAPTIAETGTVAGGDYRVTVTTKATTDLSHVISGINDHATVGTHITASKAGSGADGDWTFHTGTTFHLEGGRDADVSVDHETARDRFAEALEGTQVRIHCKVGRVWEVYQQDPFATPKKVATDGDIVVVELGGL